MIRLRVLGSLQLCDADGGELRSVIAQPKRLALLAYLAVATGLQRRDRLLAMFWPELDAEHARNSLSQAVRFLRRELPSEVVVTRGVEEVGVDPASIWCDAVAFASELSAAHYGDALELYRGDLLDGFYIEAAPAFEEWLERERARLRAGASKAARAAAELREGQGQFTTAVSNARLAVELAHPDERALRELLELLDRLGDRAGALHAYEQFAQRFSNELDATPSPETLALVQRIRSDGSRGDRSEATTARPSDVMPAVPAFTRWRVERELARGGMGTVYLARDKRHDRPVAIKTIRHDLLTRHGVQRFLREIQITASLAHPHILPLIDSGSSKGVPFLVTPYIGGESLRVRLSGAKRLSIRDAIRIAREIADALAYAHGRGIVHRDVKPENVLLADGHALVTDFGVARSGIVPRTEKDIAGSPGYMSPEQSGGASGVGARSDIYSLGCVLHEMLTQQLPAAGDNAREIRKRRPDMPRQLAQLLASCVAADPAQRPASAAMVSHALSAVEGRLSDTEAPRSFRPPRFARMQLATAGIALAATALGGGVLVARSGPTPTLPRVAVASFRNMTGDESFYLLGGSISRAVADGFAGLPVEVIPMGQGDSRSRYTVTGAFYRRGDSLEFLLDIVDDARRRALPQPVPVRVPADSPFAAGKLLSNRAMGALAYYTSIYGIDSTAQRRPPTYAAYVAFAEGQSARLQFDWYTAEAALRRAIALDPSFTEAYFFLGRTFQNQAGHTYRRGGMLGRYEAMDSLAASRRRASAPMTETDSIVVDFLTRVASGDPVGSLDATQRLSARFPPAMYDIGFHGVGANRPRAALTGLDGLDPDEGWTREWIPYWTQRTAALHQLGEHEEELRTARIARTRFPHHVRVLHVELRAQIAAGEGEKVTRTHLGPADVLQLALELRTHGYGARSREWLTALADSASEADVRTSNREWILPFSLLTLGRVSEAVESLEASLQRDSLRIDLRGLLGTAYARQGRREAAQRLSTELAAIKTPYLHGLPTLWRAKIAARLGDRDQAVELLARARREGVRFHPEFPSQRGTIWHTDPDFESLRGYRRFDDVMRPR